MIAELGIRKAVNRTEAQRQTLIRELEVVEADLQGNNTAAALDRVRVVLQKLRNARAHLQWRK